MNLKLVMVEEADLPSINKIDFETFVASSPIQALEYPDGFTALVESRTLEVTLEKYRNPKYTYMKVVDQDTRQIIAFAYWFTNTEDAPESVWNQPIPVIDSQTTVEAAYSAGLQRLRQTYIRGRRRIHLGVLATLPEYQNRGAGSLLLEACSRHAEKTALPVTILANIRAAGLYQRHGYHPIDGAVDDLNLEQWGLNQVWTTILMLKGEWAD